MDKLKLLRKYWETGLLYEMRQKALLVEVSNIEDAREELELLNKPNTLQGSK